MNKLKMRYGLTWGIRPDRTKTVLKDSLFLVTILFLVLAIYGWIQERDESDRQAEEARMHKMSLKPATDIIHQCLKGGDNPIRIGDEIWLCGAVRTGVKL